MNGSEDRLRFARYLVRMSVATRVIGILCSVGALLTILVTLSSVRNSSDRVGFTLIGLTILLFGVLVWGTGVFHGAVGRTLPTVVAIDEKLAWLTATVHTMTTRTAEPEPEPEAELPAPESAEPEPEPEPEPTEGEAVAAPAETDADIPRVPCPHCGGAIHPQASRCVHCMKKIKR